MSFLTNIDPRRRKYLSLINEIDSGLREAYAIRHEQGRATQSSLAEKLGVNRSVIHRRLTSQSNLTVETIADMIWALDYGFRCEFYDPETEQLSNSQWHSHYDDVVASDQTSGTSVIISTSATAESATAEIAPVDINARQFLASSTG